MKRSWSPSRLVSVSSLVLLVSVAASGCANSSSAIEEEVGVATAAIQSGDQEAVERTLVPLRKLADPGNVYMKSIEETYALAGTYAHVVHVYNPRQAGGIRFELAAKTSNGFVDPSGSFNSVVVTPIVAGADGTPLTFSNASGQAVYVMPSSEVGWYRLSFNYVAANPGRTLKLMAYDDTGSSLKTSWHDPPGSNVQVRLKVMVEQTAPVFLKGGAYRNTSTAEYAYLDNVNLNGYLLYRRAFDQGQFNFPLGTLGPGEHNLEFSLEKSGSAPGKFWFGVNETTYSLNPAKTEWSPVQFVYQGPMHTGDYDAWNEGVACAQGSTLVAGIRPPPVRRGTTFSVTLEHAMLNGTGMNATLRIYPYGSGSETNWAASLPSGLDYAGGLFSQGGFSRRYREHWKVSVPSSAPIGRYVLRAMAPNGIQIGQDVLFYVTHNPYTLVSSGSIGKAVLETYGYDEDEDGVNLNGEYGSDRDAARDHFTAVYFGAGNPGEYYLRSKITGAFRRLRSDTDFSMLDYAMAAGQGTTSEFASMRRYLRLVNQRFDYLNPHNSDNTESTFLDGGSMTLADAAIYAKPGAALPEDHRGSGECFEYGSSLAALARSSGILTRVISSSGALGGWGNHVFTEAYLPGLPLHGGKVSNSNSSANSDSDPWYAFDATDVNAADDSAPWTRYSEAIAPRAQYGRARLVLEGSLEFPIQALTNTLSWDPLISSFDTTTDVSDVTSAYLSGPEFWLTSSGVTGWLGFGEKDVYRIHKATTGAKAIRVRTLPNDGEFLVPKLCVGSVANSPIMPERCANAAAWQALPAGESYVIVFNDSALLGQLKGDSVQYVLELEY